MFKPIQKFPRPWPLVALALAGALLGGCPEDPLGPDNRMALLAFGRCDHAQAVQFAARAIASEDPRYVQRAWMLKLAMARDQGDSDAALAISAQLETAWANARGGTLTAARRERELGILSDIAHQERRAQGLPADCAR